MFIYSKLKSLYQEKRLPWFVSSHLKKIRNSFFFLNNQRFHVFSDSKLPLITYVCGFHGETGGAIAAASIANLLSNNYRVEFVSYLSSDINHLINTNVKLVFSPNLQSDVFICDAECQHAFYEKLKVLNKKIIISCHCFPDKSHGLTEEYITKSLTYADQVHFVSQEQQDAFKLTNNQCTIIANTSQKIIKTNITNNVGSVGNLNDIRKNAAESINIALASSADTIHLWSVKKDIWHNERIIAHLWETDKTKIYNSFDVLVFMSELETFGLVVIEAMSAGIPCYLSNIPVFEQFKSCPGIIIDNKNDSCEKKAIILNDLLSNKENISKNMISYFDEKYSGGSILKNWISLVSKTRNNQ